MPFRHVGSLKFLQFDVFDGLPLHHGVFTRQGGVSPAPWDTLNLGGTVGDDPERVRLNKRRLIEAMGATESDLFEVWQMHTDRVVLANGPRRGDTLIQADAMVTRTSNVTLLMRFADCVPILLYDAHSHSIGMAHAGWLGTVRKTALATVVEMSERLASRPENLVAAIGPSICVDHYPVGPEVVEQVQAAFGEGADEHLVSRNGEIHFDLWSANRALLKQAGVGAVEVCGVCTACHPEDWFSHRGESGLTGRFGAALSLAG